MPPESAATTDITVRCDTDMGGSMLDMRGVLTLVEGGVVRRDMISTVL